MLSCTELKSYYGRERMIISLYLKSFLLSQKFKEKLKTTRNENFQPNIFARGFSDWRKETSFSDRDNVQKLTMSFDVLHPSAEYTQKCDVGDWWRSPKWLRGLMCFFFMCDMIHGDAISTTWALKVSPRIKENGAKKNLKGTRGHFAIQQSWPFVVHILPFVLSSVNNCTVIRRNG